MIKRHIKRLVFPKSWNVLRKANTFSLRPNPSGHKKEMSMPVGVLLRDVAGMTNTKSETQKLINDRVLLIDGKKIKTAKRPVGFMDVLSFDKIDEHYVITLAKNGKLEMTKSNNPKQKVCKITKKWMAKGGKITYATHDGRLFDLNTNDYKVGDSLVVELPKQKVVKCLKLDKGATGIFLGGKNTGKQVTLNQIVATGNRQPDFVEFELDGNKHIGLKKQFFVLGKDGKLEI